MKKIKKFLSKWLDVLGLIMLIPSLTSLHLVVEYSWAFFGLIIIAGIGLGLIRINTHQKAIEEYKSKNERNV